MNPTVREHVTTIDGAVRYWLTVELGASNNSSVLHDVLRVSTYRARRLWTGRAPFTTDELEHLCAVLDLPVAAFLNLDHYQAERRRQRRSTDHAEPAPVVRAGDALRTLRELAGLNIDDVAVSAGIDAGHIAAIEAGQRIPTPGMVADITAHTAGIIGRGEQWQALRDPHSAPESEARS